MPVLRNPDGRIRENLPFGFERGCHHQKTGNNINGAPNANAFAEAGFSLYVKNA
jgi:hypothetical protein